MSKRKSSAVPDKPHKRVRAQDEDQEEDDNNGYHIARPRIDTRVLCGGEPPSDVGIVESITLKNFMCHSNLGPFAFGSNVNFVVGNNGSGKSAILTALIVALGGNAQATNRGLSLKGFVKEGESSADVSITLRNKGKDSFKPEIYGPAITVDLRITRDGLRTYKLRSKTGQIVSTKKEELLSILDSFNIQVNNPISVLTQEMSKYFLHSKGEGDKYKFFMKATQLDQMREDFIHVKTTKELTENKVNQQSECLKDLKKTYMEKDFCYKNLASLDEMHNKLEELRKQMAWALVMEAEKELLPLKEKLQSDKRSTQKYDDKVDEWERKVEQAEENFKEVQERLDGITQRVQVLQPKSAQLKAEAQKRNALLKSSEVSVHRCRANLRDLDKDKAQLSSKINELKQSIKQSTGAESRARTERIERIQAEMVNLGHHISTLGQQIEQYQHASNRAKEELHRKRQDHEAAQRSIDSKRRNLRTLESSRSNRLRRFGEHMPALLAAIQEADRRGFCISLKDPRFALAVEVCLKNLLQAFTCDNYEDERVLKGLMSKAVPGGRRPAIITSQFYQKVHDTREWAVHHPEYRSVLQTLEIEDPVVANCLIDQRGIERILLIQDKTDARRVMQGHSPPKNCVQAFSVEGDQIFPDKVYTAEQRRANVLSGDVEEEIRHLRREIDSQMAQDAHLLQEFRAAEEDIRKTEGLLRRAVTEQRTSKDKVTKLQLEMTDLQNVEEPQSEDLQPLEEDLQEITSRITSKRATLEDAQAQVAQLKASYEEAEQEYNQHKDQISSIAEEADVIKDELSKNEQEVTKCKHHRKHYEEKRKIHLCNIRSIEETLAAKERDVQTSVAKASEICPERLDVRRTARSLDSEISRLKAKISTQQEQQEDREEVVRQYYQAMEDYKNMAQQMKNLNSFVKCLEGLMNNRLKAYAEFRRYLAARCKYYFNCMLAQRGYMGSMTFDHKNETLSIMVQPGQGTTADTNDMRLLSGGERSFSTVCFVLSLWAITEAPFRCLDEFDVYMDMVNRRISMDMMLRVADSQLNRQFIFLTPQNMSSLPESSMISILRLKDPERGSKIETEKEK